MRAAAARAVLVLIVAVLAGLVHADAELPRRGQMGVRLAAESGMKERPRDRGVNFEVLYHHVVSGGSRIRTLVSRPTKPGRHAVFFFIAGMGPVSIDEPLSGPSAESRIVSAFADGGYVTVRVEKPGVGDSEGGPYGDVEGQGLWRQ